MRNPTFYLFLGVVSVLDALVHYYLYLRLFRDPGWSPMVRRAGLIGLVALGVFLPVGIALAPALPRRIGGAMAMVSFTWMGLLLYLGLVVVSADLLKLFTAAVRFATTDDLLAGRREALARGAAVTAGVLTAGVSVPALRSGLGEITREEVEVKLPRLPPALVGMKIVQVSDIHVGPTIGRDFMKSLVEKVNAEKPDLIVVTGDLVDGTIEQLAAHVAPLSRLQSRFGSYFVTGNHEYYSGVDAWTAHIERLGLRVLRNERVSVGDAASFDLGGIDDETAGRHRDGHGPDVSKIVTGRDEERELILLAHQPRSIRFAERSGASLQLSGHTHGGQLWPASAFVRLTTPYVAGLYRHDARTQVYVSRGTGYWGPPMRLGAPAEISVLHVV